MPVSPINKQARLWAARGDDSLGRRRNPETGNSPTTLPGAVRHVSRLVGRQIPRPVPGAQNHGGGSAPWCGPRWHWSGTRWAGWNSLQRHAADAAAAWFYRRHQAAGACLDDGHAGMQFKCVVRDGFVSRPGGCSGLRLTNVHVTTKKRANNSVDTFLFPRSGPAMQPDL